MPLDAFKDFFVACIGASASFIGLLFVGLSVVLSRSENDNGIAFTDRRLAESAFTALVDIFFVSLSSLIPGVNLGYPSVIVAVIGLRSSNRLYQRFREHRADPDDTMAFRRIEVVWLIASSLIYVVQGYVGIRMLVLPLDDTNTYAAVAIMLILFGAGLFRSWELMGIRRR